MCLDSNQMAREQHPTPSLRLGCRLGDWLSVLFVVSLCFVHLFVGWGVARVRMPNTSTLLDTVFYDPSFSLSCAQKTTGIASNNLPSSFQINHCFLVGPSRTQQTTNKQEDHTPDQKKTHTVVTHDELPYYYRHPLSCFLILPFFHQHRFGFRSNSCCTDRSNNNKIHHHHHRRSGEDEDDGDQDNDDDFVNLTYE